MGVFNELWYIDLKQSTGPDGISAKFLKECSFILLSVMTFVFNKSLETGIFPNVWKFSFLSPTFMKGNKSLVTNYR